MKAPFAQPSTSFYQNVESNPDFSAIETQILAWWKEQKLFEASVEAHPATKNHQSNSYVFYDGPPFANGLPHYGHLLTGFVKDIVARYQTQNGKRVERRFGWDCHGLPAEMAAEKELGVSGRTQITEFGIEKFNDYCRTSVMRYTNEWEYYVTRQARWVDFANSYKTMDTNYMESVIWAFKELYKKGLIYESMRVMPYSWACETPLSNFETRMDNAYRERADKAVTAAFRLKEKPAFIEANCTHYKLLAWTTTPWTLPSNLALAVGPEITYTYVIKEDTCFILAASSLAHYAKELESDQPNQLFPGTMLLGLHYEPLFSYFAHHEAAFRILPGEFVLEGDGTGIVHMAPGFGEDDFNVCEKEGISLVCPVDNAGKFTQEVTDFAGMHVFDANDEIIKMLKHQGKWFKTEQYLHNYPHCWRTDTPLIYKAVPSWYVKVTDIKERMVELNQQIQWIPEHVRDGLFGKWLENARDWSISRNRFWGTPLPVWKSDDPRYPRIDVYGSIAEIEKDFHVKVTDLHKPFIDQLVRANPEDPTGQSKMVRVSDVFDCWFESGSMPFAQAHYPFENKAWFEERFPADFIVEYAAQTRGWFYTLMVLSTALFDQPPFKNCICHGVILDEKGQKLSKRLNNYADPKEIFASYGADAMRWLMVSSPVMRGQELLIDKEGKMIRDVLRLTIKPIWNAFHFFTLYANADQMRGHLVTDPSHILDRYILAKTREAILAIQQAMDSYDIPSACRAVEACFEVLNNWYIRRSRERFWTSVKDADKQAAYDTLYTVLHVMCRASAPLLPLLTEAIYQGLTSGEELLKENSVHLAPFPDPLELPEEKELVMAMDRVRDVCNAALGIRNAENLRVRLPLNSLKIIGAHASLLVPFQALIQEEVNVKQVEFFESIEGAATRKLQLNFPILGKRLPEKMKTIIAASKQGLWEQSAGRVTIAGETLLPEEYTLLLEPKEKRGSAPLSTQDGLILLDIQLTPQLKQEGLARDIVRAIQQARKEAKLQITDNICLKIEAPAEVQEACLHYQAYILEQTLAIEIVSSEHSSEIEWYLYETEFDEGVIKIALHKS